MPFVKIDFPALPDDPRPKIMVQPEPTIQLYADAIAFTNQHILHSATRIALLKPIADNWAEPNYKSTNPWAIIDRQRQACISDCYPCYQAPMPLKPSEKEKKSLYLRNASRAKSSHHGDCAEYANVTAEYLEQQKFDGNIFIATYPEHQFVIVRANKDPSLEYRPGDWFIDSWSGCYAPVENAQNYPLQFTLLSNKAMDGRYEIKRSESKRPPMDFKPSDIRYEFYWNDPRISR